LSIVVALGTSGVEFVNLCIFGRIRRRIRRLLHFWVRQDVPQMLVAETFVRVTDVLPCPKYNVSVALAFVFLFCLRHFVLEPSFANVWLNLFNYETSLGTRPRAYRILNLQDSANVCLCTCLHGWLMRHYLMVEPS
jgi:hypothetical protein